MEDRLRAFKERSSSLNKKPELVLIPGLLNDADLWRDQIAGLCEVAACHVADITKGRTLRELAENVLATAPPCFSLAGFSLGGYVAQEIMRVAPGRVTRLALLDTSIRTDTPIARRSVVPSTSGPCSGSFGFGDRLLKNLPRSIASFRRRYCHQNPGDDRATWRRDLRSAESY
jgi:pimeloyl-ACP methyl ester carboxylesterase